MMAVSNGPAVSEESNADGSRTVTFARTMKMSTYLVAFVVGELEATEVVDVDGVPLRIIHTPGKGNLARFALDVGAFSLRYFSDYYGIPYPGDKLDMVAVPDFAWGAMENLGCVTYRETALLVDPDKATQAEQARVADVIAHELAHMWFGDLVTMKLVERDLAQRSLRHVHGAEVRRCLSAGTGSVGSPSQLRGTQPWTPTLWQPLDPSRSQSRRRKRPTKCSTC